MDIKKTPEADLEKERFTFFLMGFAVALSVFFVLLEWQSSEPRNTDISSLGPVFIEKEFEGGVRTEIEAPVVIPVTPEQEIVYEDYIITEDIPVIEKIDETISISVPSNFDTDITLSLQKKIETIAPVESKKQAETATSAEIMPQFQGGQTALIRFLYQNIKYPSAALKQRIEGRVWCSFIVEMDGSISNVTLEEGVYIFFDEEAVRVLNMMPNWIPGRTNGENVRVKIYIPVVFKR